MFSLSNKHVLVIGLGLSGAAASRLLCAHGATVWAVDNADTEALRRDAAALRSLGVDVHLGASEAPRRQVDLAVVSPGVSRQNPLVQEMARRQVPIIGELELGYQQSLCL